MFDKEILNRLFRYACSLTKDQDQAFDLVQSGIEKMLRRNTNRIDNTMAYLMRAIRNEFIDQARQNNLYQMLPINEDSSNYLYEVESDLTLDDILIQNEDLDLLLSKLSVIESELLYLWAVEEYTFDEIAQLQDLSRGTVLSRMSRMKKRIKLELQDKISVAWKSL